jgi:hypothetical protein
MMNVSQEPACRPMSVMTTGIPCGAVDVLDRLGDDDAVAGEQDQALDPLCVEVFEVGDLAGRVGVAAVGEDDLELGAFLLPLGGGLLGTVGHRHEERVGAPELRVSQRELLVGLRREHRAGDHRRGGDAEQSASDHRRPP